jgi:uncharacterized protein YdhG (YjbR/CyaY superfamily)
MKKANSAARTSAAKGNVAPKNVDDYLAGVPEPARSTLNKVRAAIRSALPAEATEAISYRIPTVNYKGPMLAPPCLSKKRGDKDGAPSKVINVIHEIPHRISDVSYKDQARLRSHHTAGRNDPQEIGR